MTDKRSEKPSTPGSREDAKAAGERPGANVKDHGKGVQATGGDKGSKKTNDYETSGRDRNAEKGSHNPENFGREGMDNEKVSRRRDTEKSVRGTEEKGAAQGDERPGRERTTEAGVVASNETKNHSQAAIEPGSGADPDKKPRKTTKGERGSRKPGTELTKAERAAHA